MSSQRRPVHHGVACAAVPCGVAAAALPEASDVSDEDLIRAEAVSVGAPVRGLGHPLTVDGSDELTLVYASKTRSFAFRPKAFTDNEHQIHCYPHFSGIRWASRSEVPILRKPTD